MKDIHITKNCFFKEKSNDTFICQLCNSFGYTEQFY